MDTTNSNLPESSLDLYDPLAFVDIDSKTDTAKTARLHFEDPGLIRLGWPVAKSLEYEMWKENQFFVTPPKNNIT